MSVNLGSAYGKIIIDNSGAVGPIRQVSQVLVGLGGPFGLASAGAIGLGIGLAGVGAAAVGLGGVISSSVDAAADLEQQLDQTQAVTGATNEEMTRLKDLITNLGMDPNLKVSSMEAAQAIDMLARNGLNVTQIMDGAARSTVLLANATQADFATAANIATDTMALFNIQAADMDKAVNGIASVVTASKFDINDYRLALAQGGGVAASVGMQFDDFNATIAGIAPLFASGSDAGTSLKMMLQNLIPKSKEAADKMRDLGLYSGLTEKEMDKAQGKLAKVDQQIAKLNPNSKNYAQKLAELQQKHDALSSSLEVGKNAFFDEEGNMRSMVEIAGVLDKAFSGLSDEKKNDALSTIFGTDAMRAALGVAKLGEDGFRNLQAEMAKTDAAQMAATTMDNYRGKAEILGGVIESLKIRIGDEFLPALGDGAVRLTTFLTENQDSIVAFFGGLADGAEWASGKMSELLPVVLDFARYILAIVEGGKSFGEVDGLFQKLPESVQPFALAIGDLVRMGKEEIPGFIETIKGLATEVITAFNNEGFAGVGKLLWSKIFGGDEGPATGTELLTKVLTAITTFLTNNWPTIDAELTKWSTQFWGWVDKTTATSGEQLNKIVENLRVWANDPATQEKLRQLGVVLGKALVDALELVIQNQERMNEVVGKLLLALATAALATAETAGKVGADIGAGLIAGIISKITGEEASSQLTKTISNVLKAIISALNPAIMIANAVSGLTGGGSQPAAGGTPTATPQNPNTEWIGRHATGGSVTVPGPVGAGDMPFLIGGATPGERIDFVPNRLASQGNGAEAFSIGDISIPITVSGVSDPAAAAREVRRQVQEALENIFGQARRRPGLATG